MANPFSQKVRQRKFIYFALILVLLTGSLMHRKWWVEPAAVKLKLREVAKGEAELTGSAVRLTLTGSRGLAVTFLWSAALRQQERHEWNELELVTSAITKLQPYFISPWLFQGWNLAYNVAVECDRPHDKYYYVSRGLHLLAEGERRNHDQSLDPNDPDVGQPDLRHFIGVAYQGKFGVSDEKITMRSLLDMSTIDPVRRDPQRFWMIGGDGRKTVNLQELARFCKDYPRLVRRLREHLGYSDPKRIVAFLEENRELPTRYERPTGDPNQTETPLKKDIREQFPVLPPPQGSRAPNPHEPDLALGPENFDVFICSRAWFEYAQQSVPPPSPIFGEATYDPFKYRIPKAPALMIFRSYPARAQSYSSEVMEEEGWFDADGWLIRDWFDELQRAEDEGGFRVGTEVKYHAIPAWERTYRAYRTFGETTGQYLPEDKLDELEKKSAKFRQKYRVHPSDIGPINLTPQERDDKEMVESQKAHQQLVFRAKTIHLTNFDGFFYHAEAERTVEQMTARKLFYQAERLRRFENPEQAVGLFDAAWPLWLGTCLRFPKFIEQSSNQEDCYELQLKHLRLMQKQYPALYQSLTTGLAQASIWPHVPLGDLLDQGDKGRILPIRTVRGPLDSARVYQVKGKDEISRFLLAWSQAAGTPRLYLFPNQEYWTLAAFDFRDRELKPGWAHMIEDYSIQAVKSRFGLLPTPPPSAPLPSGVDAMPPGAVGQQPTLPSRPTGEPAPKK
jgi:hypothetical protein